MLIPKLDRCQGPFSGLPEPRIQPRKSLSSSACCVNIGSVFAGTSPGAKQLTHSPLSSSKLNSRQCCRLQNANFTPRRWFCGQKRHVFVMKTHCFTVNAAKSDPRRLRVTAAAQPPLFNTFRGPKPRRRPRKPCKKFRFLPTRSPFDVVCT